MGTQFYHVTPELELFFYASLPQGSLCEKVTFRISLEIEGETRAVEKAAAQWETEVSGPRLSRAVVSKLCWVTRLFLLNLDLFTLHVLILPGRLAKDSRSQGDVTKMWERLSGDSFHASEGWVWAHGSL